MTSTSPARPANGDRDAREAEVELRLREIRARGEHVRLGLLRLHAALVEFALRDRAVDDQRFGARQLLLGERDARLGAGRVRTRGIGGGLVFAIVDREEQLAFLDQAAFLVVHAPEVAGHARADLSGLDRLDVAAVLVPFGDRFPDDRGDADVGGRWLLLSVAAAGGEQSRARIAAKRRNMTQASLANLCG